MEDAPRTNLQRSRWLRWVLPVLVLAAVGGYAVFRSLPRTTTPPPTATAAGPAADAAPAAAAAPAPAVPELPATAAEAPSLLERASQHPLFRKGLAGANLLRRWAIVVENLAAGTSPRRELAFLDPHAPFSVVRRGDALVIAPDAYARYDDLGDAIASVDAKAAASAYRRLHAVLDAAYRALGYPGAGGLDRATARALRRLADAPLPKDDVAVVQQEGAFAFADPRLEQLPEVEKHLLRMGPRNERLVQTKARELLGELNLPVVASKP